MAAFFEILGYDCRDPRGDIAAAHISLLLEDVADAVAGKPGCKHDEQDGGARS